MSAEELIERLPFLYHLTSFENSELILENRVIHSTVALVNGSNLGDDEKQNLLVSRRPEHFYVEDIDGNEIMIRDQRPISVKSLNKCLQDNCSVSDFIFYLNSRIFFWPNLYRLNIHFNRYSHENPVILKCSTEALLSLNDHSKFCHLNSGATRCHPKWDGAPPPRGLNSFVSLDNFEYGYRKIAEVTFEDSCTLPETIWRSDNPNGPWQEV
ncbi:DUF7002 family protein [Flagellimonas allohymeniacidonis]|uniref:DUF4433 domain-containing protein n=1 Tax=Flagellimonas allohymeniacidonis TaxID=2517819 RepID=A0A4Q8QBA6_9FLAO|nr:hypothetical protein [Allomuricauda hymeniacidonis]TAI47632.1 hypothetical protein EW142_13290 [Allomuricauda hymeniacidonis]